LQIEDNTMQALQMQMRGNKEMMMISYYMQDIQITEIQTYII